MTRTRDHEGVTLRTWSSGNLSRGHDRTKPGLILVYPSRSFDTDCGHKSRRVPRSFVIMSAAPPRRHQICYITLFPVWNQPRFYLNYIRLPAAIPFRRLFRLLLLAIHPSVMGWIFWIDDNGVSLFRNLFLFFFSLLRISSRVFFPRLKKSVFIPPRIVRF